MDEADSMEDMLPGDELHGRQQAVGEAGLALDAALPEQGNAQVPGQQPEQQPNAQRQRDLEEALILQMDMQKRLHEQLEVSSRWHAVDLPSRTRIGRFGLHQFCRHHTASSLSRCLSPHRQQHGPIVLQVVSAGAAPCIRVQIN